MTVAEVFDETVVAAFGARLANARPFARHRHAVLTVTGPYPQDDDLAYRQRKLRAERASWEAYLDAASATGLLDADVIGRLRGDDEHGFRSAMAECLAAWLFAGKLKMPITPKPPGRRGSRLELLVNHCLGSFNVEVKAPKTEVPESNVWSGNDAHVLTACLRAANEQFPNDAANVLVVVPEFRVPITNDRYQLLQAFIGEFAISIPIRVRDGAPAGESTTVFLPRGAFVRSRGRLADGTLDPLPAYTRVSAIVSIEERYFDPAALRNPYTKEQIEEAGARGDKELIGQALYDATLGLRRSRQPMWIEHNVFVVHNPRAARPLDESVFEQFPQLVLRGEGMEWTDGHPPMSM